MSRALRDRTEYAAYAAVTGALGLLPENAARGFGRGLGRIVAALAGRRARLLRSNLELAYPELGRDERRRIERDCWHHFGRVVVDYLRFGRLDAAGLLDRIELEGVEHFQAARARGKGVFLLSAHLGHWEVGALAAGLLGEPIGLVVRPLDNLLLEAELRRLRERLGNRVISKREAAREMLRAMRSGETVAILTDQKVQPEEAVVVPFFGRPARTTPALARIALRTDASVVPVFCRPSAEGARTAYRLSFSPAIVPSELPEAERAVEPLTARFMAVIEVAIRERPELWLWMHDRWRGAPASTPETDLVR